MPDLTAKQDEFVKAYIAGPTMGNATQSAIVSGYSEKTAGSIGDENLKKPAIAQAIAEHRAKQAKKFEITVEGQMKKHELIFQKATKANQYSAANAAVKAQSDLVGIAAPKRAEILLETVTVTSKKDYLLAVFEEAAKE